MLRSERGASKTAVQHRSAERWSFPSSIDENICRARASRAWLDGKLRFKVRLNEASTQFDAPPTALQYWFDRAENEPAVSNARAEVEDLERRVEARVHSRAQASLELSDSVAPAKPLMNMGTPRHITLSEARSRLYRRRSLQVK